MFDKILVGTDDAATARSAVEAAAQIAVMSKGELHVASTDAPTSFKATSDGEKFEAVNTEDGVESLLQVLAFVTKEYGVEPILHPLHGDPADSLVAMADELDVDLIVVGNRGMKGVRRILGSVANSVAHSANCSVLIVETAK